MFLEARKSVAPKYMLRWRHFALVFVIMVALSTLGVIIAIYPYLVKLFRFTCCVGSIVKCALNYFELLKEVVRPHTYMQVLI